MTQAGDSKAKKGLHPRNPHRDGYDFPALVRACPELAPFVGINEHGIETIDFAVPEAVLALNRALLSHHYGVQHWGLPPGYLCPPIPGRADYLHHLADLLAETPASARAKAGEPGASSRRPVRALDLGTGANVVYPILGCSALGWSFVGSDIDERALRHAQAIVDANPCLRGRIELRLQSDPAALLRGLVRRGEYFDVVLSNPPFHGSQAEAEAGTLRKLRNLGGGRRPEKVLNFGGRHHELVCPGGEVGFLTRLIAECPDFSTQVGWFTSLVSRSENLPAIESALKRLGAAVSWRIVDMAQGQKRSRFVAWRFGHSND